jgi:hypothetical protein
MILRRTRFSRSPPRRVARAACRLRRACGGRVQERQGHPQGRRHHEERCPGRVDLEESVEQRPRSEHQRVQEDQSSDRQGEEEPAAGAVARLLGAGHRRRNLRSEHGVRLQGCDGGRRVPRTSRVTRRQPVCRRASRSTGRQEGQGIAHGVAGHGSPRRRRRSRRTRADARPDGLGFTNLGERIPEGPAIVQTVVGRVGEAQGAA